ncbi:MAG: protein kinase [Polyangiales bacterium]
MHEDEDDAARELAPGTFFASYQIVRTLGAGAFGVVYEALRQPLGKRVALKVLRVELASRAGIAQRFLREAQMTAQLRHPHVVETFDVGAHEGAPYLAMEFLEGEALSQRIAREGKLAPEAVIDLMLPVLSAMATVHDAGVVHRDLKPENIFLVRTRGATVFPKVLDFGIAKAGGDDKAMALTRTATVLGTPYYMSPEQAHESKHIDARSDQWSLGVIVYECLTGVRPFTGDSLLEVFGKIASGRLAPLSDVAPATPSSLVAVVDRMLQVSPADRFEDVRAVGRALLPLASEPTRVRWSEEFSGSSDAPRASPWVVATDAARVSLAGTLAPRESVSPSASTAARAPAWRAPAVVASLALVGIAAFVALRPSPAPGRAATSPPSHTPPVAAQPVAAQPVAAQPVAAQLVNDAATPAPDAAPPAAVVAQPAGRPRRRGHGHHGRRDSSESEPALGANGVVIR